MGVGSCRKLIEFRIHVGSFLGGEGGGGTFLADCSTAGSVFGFLDLRKNHIALALDFGPFCDMFSFCLGCPKDGS